MRCVAEDMKSFGPHKIQNAWKSGEQSLAKWLLRVCTCTVCKVY